MRSAKKIFLSSTCFDLIDLRAEVKSALEDIGYTVYISEASDFPVDNKISTYDNCLSVVRQCDIYLLIIHTRYGSPYRGTTEIKLPDEFSGEEISVTVAEYLTALDAGLEVGLASAHQSLDLRPTVLNRREVRRVCRQPQDLCFDVADRLLDLTGLVYRQIIQEHNIRGTQLRNQHLIDIRIKGYSINRALKTERRKQSAQTQTSDQSHSFAMIARHALIDSFATRRTPISSGQGQMKACFVGEDQTATIQAGNSAAKALSVGFDPLRSSKAFFYEAARTFAEHGRQLRYALRLWLSFSSEPQVLRVSRQAAARLAGATISSACHRGWQGSLHRAVSGSSRSIHDNGGANERQCGGQPQRLMPSRLMFLHHFRKPLRSSRVNQSSKPS